MKYLVILLATVFSALVGSAQAQLTIQGVTVVTPSAPYVISPTPNLSSPQGGSLSFDNDLPGPIVVVIKPTGSQTIVGQGTVLEGMNGSVPHNLEAGPYTVYVGAPGQRIADFLVAGNLTVTAPLLADPNGPGMTSGAGSGVNQPALIDRRYRIL